MNSQKEPTHYAERQKLKNNIQTSIVELVNAGISQSGSSEYLSRLESGILEISGPQLIAVMTLHAALSGDLHSMRAVLRAVEDFVDQDTVHPF